MDERLPVPDAGDRLPFDPRGVQALFGDIDIYLFDQLQRGRIVPGMRVFDAGCGSGRNVAFLLRQGYDVCGVDRDPGAIAAIRSLADRLQPSAVPPAEARFRCERLERHSFPDVSADVVLSSAVLHFASDEAEFDAMLEGAWRVLAPGGLFFSRLASSIGLPELPSLGHGRFRLPDGSDRYLVNAAQLIDRSARLGARFADPLKTTLVHGQRAMTTWVLWK